MFPVLIISIFLLNSIFNSPFWENLKEILNPSSSIGAEPWVFYAIYAVFVFLFNIFDIVSISAGTADIISVLLIAFFKYTFMHR